MDKQTELQNRIEAEVRRLLPIESMAAHVIHEAAQFFAYCPDDFCVQSAHWLDGHAVFGGTNRLLWNANRGYWPDPSYCTPRFLKQFEGACWEPVGQINIKGKELVLVDSTLLNLAPGEVLPRIKIPIAWNGPHNVLGRKSIRGDGQLAEVRIITGAEA